MKKHKGCTKKTVRKDWIEDLIMAEIAEMLLDDANIERIVSAVMDYQVKGNQSLPLMKKQLDETTKAIENMLNAIGQGIFTTSTKERLEALEETKKQLELEITMEDLFNPHVSEDKIRFWLHKFREGDVQDPDHRQRLVDSFINVIYLFDDHFVITFNYKEGCKTVSLCDIMGASDKHKANLCSDLCAVAAPNIGIAVSARTSEQLTLNNKQQMKPKE